MTVRRMTAILLGACAAAGCAVISREVRKDAVPLRDFQELRQAVESFSGRTVILGGEIIEVRNHPEGTTVVVLERRLGLGQRPDYSAESGGRFLARFSQYLDPVVFAAEREITVAGRVAGTVTEPVGQAPYRYVVLDGVEIHLWREPPPYVYPWAYDPWYPWYPSYPWWYDHRYGHRPW